MLHIYKCILHIYMYTYLHLCKIYVNMYIYIYICTFVLNTYICIIYKYIHYIYIWILYSIKHDLNTCHFCTLGVRTLMTTHIWLNIFIFKCIYARLLSSCKNENGRSNSPPPPLFSLSTGLALALPNATGHTLHVLLADPDINGNGTRTI